MSARLARLGSLGALALLGGCALGPDFHTPPAPAVHAYVAAAPADAAVPVAAGASQRLVPGAAVPREWWRAFGSAVLDARVQEALRANPDLAAARAALRVAWEYAAAQRGGLFPAVQAGYDVRRARDASGTLSPTLTSGTPVYTLHTAQVSVSYVLDVFGANRRALESLEAQAEAQRCEVAAAWITLTGNVVGGSINEASLLAQLEATREVIRSARETRDIVRRQVERGALAPTDLLAQEAALAASEATLPPLERQLEAQRHQLAALLGQLPEHAPPGAVSLAEFTLPEAVPTSLPAALVRQRPDVRVAEARLHAATAQVGVATANLFPQITLAGGAGSASTGFDHLFATGNRFWSGGASLTQTLFAGGSLWHQRRAAQAGLDQAGAQYRSVVLTAFQNVADALTALTLDAQAVDSAQRAEHSAAESLAAARRALTRGSAGPLAVLIAEQSWHQAALALAQARGNQLADTAALWVALGGGWNDAPLPQPPPDPGLMP